MDSKICSKCGIEKPLTEFHKQQRNKDGLRHWCKECRRRYYQANRKQQGVYDRKYYANHKNKRATYFKAYVAQFPERIKAKRAVERAVKAGKLIRPNRCSNPKCNKLCVPEGHHWSYLEEHWLDVKWLCKSCHGQIDHTNLGVRQ